MKVMMEFHKNGVIPKGSNATFLALRHKVDNPIGLNDFGPISLVGYLYKIIAKVLEMCCTTLYMSPNQLSLVGGIS